MVDDANSECGKKQTSNHLFEWTLVSSKCEMKDFVRLTKITDEMIRN